MSEKGNKPVAAVVAGLAEPVAESFGLSLWDVRYEKEGGSWYLRIFIDKEGGVNIDDCERMSRAVEKVIDERDPVDGSYYLEVSSPGIERELIKDEHFNMYIGEEVVVRFIRPRAEGRELSGRLINFRGGEITIEAPGGEITFSKKETAFVKLKMAF